MPTNNSVYEVTKDINSLAVSHMNKYLSDVMKTRGGRVGSGMGTVLETLWGYNLNRALLENNHKNFEVAWFPDHQYHDFACVRSNSDWNPASKDGEFFRVEAKSMIFGAADEPKAHFDVLQNELNQDDAILLIVWKWLEVDEYHVCPKVIDCFFDRAIKVAQLRDILHIQRGGSFVDGDHCPDGCSPGECVHHGEPLNADGKRERKTGPESTRVSQKTSHAQNFGGMLRMLKTANTQATKAMRNECKRNVVAGEFVEFIHRNFPKEELNHYSTKEWRAIAKEFDITDTSKVDIHRSLFKIGRSKYKVYLPT